MKWREAGVKGQCKEMMSDSANTCSGGTKSTPAALGGAWSANKDEHAKNSISGQAVVKG